MATLCIHNARVVTSKGITAGGIVAADGRIAARLAGTDRASADTVIDARQRLLFAGFVDAHVHMRDPGQPQKEDFSSGSTAAAIGGITTVMCMPNTRPPVDSIADSISHAKPASEGHMSTLRSRPRSILAITMRWQRCGTPASFPSRQCSPMARRGEAYVESALLLHMLTQIAALDARVGVYCGNQAVVDAALAHIRAAGRTDFPAFAESRPAISEALGLALLIEARHATGAKIIARQVSTARGFELVAAAKARAPDGAVAVEVTPHHLHLDSAVLARLGPYAQMLPPLRSPADVSAAQQAAAAGVVDFIGSDHAPHALAEKTSNPWESPSGTPGLDTFAAAALDLAARQIIDYPRVAALLSEQPAKLFGLADRKGSLATGADADFVLVDPQAPLHVTPAVIHSRAARSPFEGMTLQGRPVMTILRGEIIAEDGALVATKPGGRFLARMAAHAK